MIVTFTLQRFLDMAKAGLLLRAVTFQKSGGYKFSQRKDIPRKYKKFEGQLREAWHESGVEAHGPASVAELVSSRFCGRPCLKN